MSNFVMGLLVVQVLLGAYQFSFTTGSGRPESNARASRLPSPVIFGHMVVAGIAAGLWFLHLWFHTDAIAWVVLAVLVGSIGTGGFMFLRTAPKDDWKGGRSRNPADHWVAEKQIPGLALAVHGLIALGLVVCVLLVCLGVAH